MSIELVVRVTYRDRASSPRSLGILGLSLLSVSRVRLFLVVLVPHGMVRKSCQCLATSATDRQFQLLLSSLRYPFIGFITFVIFDCVFFL